MKSDREGSMKIDDISNYILMIVSKGHCFRECMRERGKDEFQGSTTYELWKPIILDLVNRFLRTHILWLTNSSVQDTQLTMQILYQNWTCPKVMRFFQVNKRMLKHSPGFHLFYLSTILLQNLLEEKSLSNQTTSSSHLKVCSHLALCIPIAKSLLVTTRTQKPQNLRFHSSIITTLRHIISLSKHDASMLFPNKLTHNSKVSLETCWAWNQRTPTLITHLRWIKAHIIQIS